MASQISADFEKFNLLRNSGIVQFPDMLKFVPRLGDATGLGVSQARLPVFRTFALAICSI